MGDEKMGRRSNRAGTIEWVPGRDGAPGHYKARISLADGSRPWIHFEPGISKDSAQKKAASQTEKARERGATYAPKRGPRAALAKPAGATVALLVEPWLELVRADPDLAPATVSMHEQNANGRITKGLGPLRPEELTTGTLRRWIRSMRDEELSPSRIRNVFNSLGKMIDCSMAEEWIVLAGNPCRHPGVREELPSVTGPDRIRLLTRDQATTLVDAPTTPVERRVRYLVALTSGMRDGEIAALTWSSIREEQGVLCFDVRRSLAIDGPEGWATPKDPKTRASRRLVPLHPQALAALETWKERGWKAYVGRAPKDDDHIFASPDGEGWRPQSAAFLRDDLEGCGLPKTFEGEEMQFRDLRHCFSTWLASAGVAEELRDRLMGHAPRTVGLRHYTGVDLARLREAVETIQLREPAPKLSEKLSEGEEKKMDERQIPQRIPGAPETTRTSGQRFRKPLLYPLSYGG
jgi:integrase